MGKLQVLFETPRQILQGLASGEMVRRGGVIQWAAGSEKGQVVAWLKEVGGLERLSPAEIPSALAQQIQQLRFASHAALAGQVLNLGVSVMGFAILNAKLNALDRKVEAVLQGLNRLSEDVQWVNQKMDVPMAARLASEFEHAALPSFQTNAPAQHAAYAVFTEGQHYYHTLLRQLLETAPYRSAELYESYLCSAAVAIVAKAKVLEMLEGTSFAARQLNEDAAQVQRSLKEFEAPVLPGSNGWPEVLISPEQRRAVKRALPPMRDTVDRLSGYTTEYDYRAKHSIKAAQWRALGEREHPGLALVLAG